ncbi:uncharacterized protein L969DRAFT_15873 [Mixia osmundae IAM 14324]|uniref:Galactose oxidase-like Early set domain-containing protein n=1 Tax=Mixia osmundae (strain CBS 9802 / IAM 14324 / JCM 22182 / KY 12970) TaxID=764103 RepID=G7E671_MIXOS|nr:uncharacterized protein L969DRAFT_15873 [Mixia osmundae IAM 14324]KEI40515.1 hypothetical protein L969DRAFT_15873 [Mixia osmundae IAM 14324]GAA98331.1 hypothetical protein E5Q_05016 [Mixia osmundae IAM 14324]
MREQLCVAVTVALMGSVSAGIANTFQVIGNTGVSAMQMFYDRGHLYILDKAENNALQVAGHPAWAAVYSLADNTLRALDVAGNTFCANGGTLGNGTWVNYGGTGAVDPGVYHDENGLQDIRLVTPNAQGDAQWHTVGKMRKPRWYASIETLPDGRNFIAGGSFHGGFLGLPYHSGATYELWPSNEPEMPTRILQAAQPCNLYPNTAVMPDGRIFMTAGYSAAIIDPITKLEIALPDIPTAWRNYPASSAMSILPLRPSRDYRFEVLLCGGSSISGSVLGPQRALVDITQMLATKSCVKIAPLDPNPVWIEQDPMLVERVMGTFVMLPTLKLLLINGAQSGLAGYADRHQFPDEPTVGESYADHPTYRPHLFDPTKPIGSRWTKMPIMTNIPRMYHSTAILLPDGSVALAGSNPNADVSSANYATEYRLEAFRPYYFDWPRPQPIQGVTHLGYGGPAFTHTLDRSDLNGEPVSSVMITLVRSAFSTHGVNWGQRGLELVHVAGPLRQDGSVQLTVNSLPANKALFPPGKALLFVVVGDRPSHGIEVTIGPGTVG